VETPSVREMSEQIGTLLDDLSQSAMPAVTQRVEELLSCVLALYGAGLERIGDHLDPDTRRQLADDELVGPLLVLHDLHPDDVDTRVQRALDQVRPYLGSHAGGVALSGVDENGIVHLQLEGSCDGCPSSALTVKNAIEDAVLMAAPDVVAVEAEGMVDAGDKGPTLLQIEPFQPHEETAHARSEWVVLDLDVPPRTMSSVVAGGESVLVANLDGTLVSYVDRCPACLTAVSEGVLDGGNLTCSCGASYDVHHAGRSLADDAAGLVPVPLLPEHGRWKMAVPQAVAP
jgi:Fe-S cluster biogenesis protein NfuA/nitrite reductase/ring-hydroxylating ferredoxin subunit